MADVKAEAKLDHFKFWIAKHQTLTPGIAVALKGQFERRGRAIPVTLTDFQWIANPVEKTYKGQPKKRQKEHLHLLGYYFDPPAQPNRKVRIHNQLETTQWTLTPPNHLLIPAAKKVVKIKNKPPDPNKPPDLSVPKNEYHFECYPILGAPALPFTVDLFDQFDDEFRAKKHETVKGLTPLWFCVPVSKTVGNKTDPIPGDDGDPDHGVDLPHLALYKFDAPALAPNRQAWARGQFNDKAFLLTVERPYLLGVPTDKTHWEPVSKSTGGKGGPQN